MYKKEPHYTQVFDGCFSELSKLNGSSLKVICELMSMVYEGKEASQTVESYAIASLRYLCDITGLNKNTIMSAIKNLEEKQWIKIFKSGKSNVYALNPSKVWKSSYHKKDEALYNWKSEPWSNTKYAIIDSTIIIEKKITKESVNPFSDIGD